MFDKHTDVIITSDFSAKAEEILYYLCILGTNTQLPWKSLDTALQLFPHPIQKVTLIIILDKHTWYLKKYFLIYFTAKNAKKSSDPCCP